MEAGGNSPPRSTRGSPVKHVGANSSGLTIRVLDVSFLPHSVTEQWLLVQSVDELNLVLEEILTIYLSLKETSKAKLAKDVPKTLRQVLSNMDCEALQVVVNGLKLIEAMAEDHAECFLSEISRLFPKLLRYLEDPRLVLRHHVLKVSIILVSRLSFGTMDKFIVFAVEQGRERSHGRPENAFKIAAVAMYRCRVTNMSFPQSTQSEPSAVLATSSIFSSILVQHNAIVKLAAIAASYLAVDALLGSGSESARDIAIDIVAGAYSLVFPSAQLSAEAVLPAPFLDMLSLDNDSYLNIPMQKLIVQRMKLNLYSSIINDVTIKSVIEYIGGLEHDSSADNSLSDSMSSPKSPYVSIDVARHESVEDRLNLSTSSLERSFDLGFVMEKKCSNSSVADNSTTSDNETTASAVIVDGNSSAPSSSAAVDRANKYNYSPLSFSSSKYKPTFLDKVDEVPTPRDESEDVSHGVLSSTLAYNPSWGDTAPAADTGDRDSWATSVADGRGSNSSEIDRSKLKTLKRAGKKPGSRRAHSAETSTSINEEYHLAMDRSPNTSDGVRTIAGADKASKGNNSVKPSKLSNESDEEEENLKNIGKLFNSYKLSSGPSYKEESERVNRLRESLMDKVSMQTEQPRKSGSPDTSKGRRTGKKTSPRGEGRKGENSFENLDSYYKLPSAAAGLTKPDEELSPSKAPPRRRQSSTVKPKSDVSEEPSSGGSPRGAGKGGFGGPPSPSRDPKSSLKAESFDYVASADIAASAAPTKELSRAIQGLENSDWPDIFHALTSIRRMALHHKSIITGSGNLHTIVIGTMKQVENLRSQAAKNAILAIGDMFQCLGQSMDAEALGISAALLRRAGDSSNIFLSESSDSAITQMIDNITPARTLAALLTGCDHRSTGVRAKSINYVLLLLERRGDELRSVRELEGLKTRVGKFLSDSSPEARAGGRDIVRTVVQRGLLSRVELEQHVSGDLLSKSLKEVGGPPTGVRPPLPSLSPKKARSSSEKLCSSDAEEEPATVRSSNKSGLSIAVPAADAAVYGDNFEENGIESSTAASTTSAIKTHKSVGGSSSPNRAKAAAAKRSLDNTPELQALPHTLETLQQSQQWSERRNALQHLTDMVINHSSVLRHAGKLDGVMDRILERLEDGSVKVQLFAIDCLQKIHQEVPLVLPSIQIIALPVLLNAASFSNKQVSAAGSEFLSFFLQSISPQAVVPQLSTIALHDKDRLRSIALRKLGELFVEYANGIEWLVIVNSVIRKHAFPAICQALFSTTTKGDVRNAAAEGLRGLAHALRIAGSYTGEQLWQWTDNPVWQDEIKRMIGNIYCT